jgi:hypothetical protein
MPSSDLAKMVAGTYIPESKGKGAADSVYAWVQEECRNGKLRPAVETFVEQQAEILEASLVLVESVGPDVLTCCIPARLSDHESPKTYPAEIRFTLNPSTGETKRLL